MCQGVTCDYNNCRTDRGGGETGMLPYMWISWGSSFRGYLYHPGYAAQMPQVQWRVGWMCG